MPVLTIRSKSEQRHRIWAAGQSRRKKKKEVLLQQTNTDALAECTDRIQRRILHEQVNFLFARDPGRISGNKPTYEDSSNCSGCDDGLIIAGDFGPRPFDVNESGLLQGVAYFRLKQASALR